MTPQQFVGLFVRLFAIWLVVAALQMIGYGVSLSDSFERREVAPYVISVVLILSAFLLWRFPLLIAHKLVPVTPTDTSTQISAAGTATVACIVLGLWVFVGRVLPAVIRDITIIAVTHANYQPLQSIRGRDLSYLIESIIDVTVALVLIFKARAIATYLLASRATEPKG